MSLTPTSTTSRLRTAKFTIVSALTLGLLGGPLAWAAPADATTSYRGCTVNPLRPSPQRNHWADFRIRVDCQDNGSVEIKQLRYEDQGGPRRDDFLGGTTFWHIFGRRGGTVTLHSYDVVPIQGRHSSERVYQLVSFRVRVGNHWSNWTRWEKSAEANVRR